MGKYILLVATAALLYVNNAMGQQDYKEVLMKTFLAFVIPFALLDEISIRSFAPEWISNISIIFFGK